jgi:hypothetical protein
MRTFTHLSYLDPDWQPESGQKYADAPKARMRVTRTTRTTVWFAYADAPTAPGQAGFTLQRSQFEADYPGVL